MANSASGVKNLRFRIVPYIVGVINLIVAVAMLVPLGVSLIFRDGDTTSFVLSFIITAGVGAVLFFGFRTRGLEVNHREGFLVVAGAWLSASFFSSIPYMFDPHFPTLVDAVFEATSGITTTGASVLTVIEGVPRGILFWRSMTHWLGGIGIVVLSVVVLPILGIGGMQLYRAEASSISGEKFLPRVKDMAKILVIIYFLMTFAMVVLLLLSGMSLYESFLHAFGSISTGGFSDKNASIAYFGNYLIEWLIVIFMFVSATNFPLHYNLYRKGFRSYLENEEFKFYFCVIAISTLLIAINISGSYSIGGTIRHAAFQVVSIVTTTGYATQDYGQWPVFSQMLLFVLMFFGGCAGSTTGAIKCVRILVIGKFIYKEIYRLIHPHVITHVKLNGKVLPPEVIKGVTGFTILFFLVFVVSSFLLSLTGLDLITSMSSAAASLGNIGPALGATGPAENYAFLTAFAKWVLIFDMVLGRLEIYTLLILFIPAFWRG